MSKFKYVVSLGYFCSPASEFERVGRRQFSLPFDWLITPHISHVLELINNGFEDFLNEEYMCQLIEFPQYYRNTRYHIDFYHDFSPFSSFKSQIGNVSTKYSRRIERCYTVIKQPTLFLRYVNAGEVDYIVNHYEFILRLIKSFNRQNEIIFVTDHAGYSHMPAEISMYYVKKTPRVMLFQIF